MPNPRLTDNVHNLKGTYQPCRHGDPDDKPVWESSLPDCPKCLDRAAKKEWKRIASIVPDGVVTLTDRGVLAQYCALWSVFEKDTSKFSSSNHTQLRMLQQELGFTPIARCKILTDGKKVPDKDAFE